MSGTASSTTAHASVACVYLDIGIQVISGIVGACMCVLSGFGFDQLDRRANNEEIEKDRLPSNSDFYSGVTLLYLFLMGLLTILAELRMKDVNQSVLRPFGFMQNYIGRGLFYAFVGSFLIAIETCTLCQVMGGMLFGMCFAQILLSVFGPRYLQDKEKLAKGEAVAKATFAPGATQGSADIASGAPGSEFGNGASATKNPLDAAKTSPQGGDEDEEGGGAGGGASDSNPFATEA